MSSYTWICLIINFLQTRNPPILPSLQAQSHVKPKVLNSFNVAFDSDARAHTAAAARNKDSIGTLLLQFFKYYGHEIDFETSVMSVRSGRVVSKNEKGWNLLLHNRLCVEEPFNNSRNLGNTADDASVRGIHLEIRRALDMLIESGLEACCEQYEYPPGDGKLSEKFVLPVSRPIVAQQPGSMRGGRGSGRGGRNGGNSNRNQAGSSRRASSASNRGQPNIRHMPFTFTPQEVQAAQQQQRYLLHDQLFQQFQYLQAQEQELRAQLYSQGLPQTPNTIAAYPHIAFPSHSQMHHSSEDGHRARAETVTHPLTAPLSQRTFPIVRSNLLHNTLQNPVTMPPSPLMAAAIPETRRNARRSSLNASSTQSMRAHSQPARPLPSPLALPSILASQSLAHSTLSNSQSRRNSNAYTPSQRAREMLANPVPAQTMLLSGFYDNDRRRPEYVGYYFGQSQPLHPLLRSSAGPNLLYPQGLPGYALGMTPHMMARTNSQQSSTISPPAQTVPLVEQSHNHDHLDADDTDSTTSMRTDMQRSRSLLGGPLIVNGSVLATSKNPEMSNDPAELQNGTAFSTSTSEDYGINTPSTSDASSQGLPDSVTIDAAGSNSPAMSENQMMRRIDGLGISNSVSPGRRRDLPSVNGVDNHHLDSSPGETSPARHIIAESRPTPEPSLSHLLVVGVRDERLSSAMQLSPVKEVPTPPPTRGNTTAGQENSRNSVKEPFTPVSAKVNGPLSNGNTPRSETNHPLLSKSNGALPAPTSSVTNITAQGGGWQTPKKKRHKKGSKSETDIVNANNFGGEFSPRESSKRKGG